MTTTHSKKLLNGFFYLDTILVLLPRIYDWLPVIQDFNKPDKPWVFFNQGSNETESSEIQAKHQRRENQVTAFGHRDILPSNNFPILKLKNYLTNKLQCQMKLSLKSSTKASNVLLALDWDVFIRIVPAGNMSVWKYVTVPTKEVFWWLNVQQQN